MSAQSICELPLAFLMVFTLTSTPNDACMNQMLPTNPIDDLPSTVDSSKAGPPLGSLACAAAMVTMKRLMGLPRPMSAVTPSVPIWIVPITSRVSTSFSSNSALMLNPF
ncbi:hypothetical protein D3C80_1413170 [compost metagenome]